MGIVQKNMSTTMALEPQKTNVWKGTQLETDHEYILNFQDGWDEETHMK